MIEFKYDAAKLDRWMATTPREVRAGLIRALRRTGTAVRRTAVDLFRQRGVGRAIFGKKAKGAMALITRSKLEERGGVLVQPIKAAGLAAMQERGGRTKAHIIKPKFKKKLAFAIHGATIGPSAVVVGQVNHPGGQYPSIPFLERAAQQHMSRFREEVEKELAKALSGKSAA